MVGVISNSDTQSTFDISKQLVNKSNFLSAAFILGFKVDMLQAYKGNHNFNLKIYYFNGGTKP